MADLLELADRVEAAPKRDRELDREAAEALGWHTRKVTGLGLNGRTPGRIMWVAPEPPWVTRPLPNMTGPRKKMITAAALRDRAPALEGQRRRAKT